ncbi:MAG: cephalosporin hydroxylase family protein [Flavobacteriales bacterium]
MKITVDTELGIIRGDDCEYSIGSPEGFKVMSDLWIRSGWDTKYVYSFSWLGRPMIQLPDDMLRIQELIFDIQPDVLIETGVAHGGSLIFYASLFKAMEKGRVIGVDIEIRPHNRHAIESHFLSKFISLIEGSSTAQETIEAVSNRIQDGERALVILDSNHTYSHVLDELRLYSKFVSVGSYIVATDGIMEFVVGAPRSNPDWGTNNPKKAAEDFVKENENFIIEEPKFPFNEGVITAGVTYWPSAYVERIR